MVGGGRGETTYLPSNPFMGTITVDMKQNSMQY